MIFVFFHDHSDAYLITFAEWGTAVVGGFAIFSVIGYMAKRMNKAVHQVITSGPGLSYIAYPTGLLLRF